MNGLLMPGGFSGAKRGHEGFIEPQPKSARSNGHGTREDTEDPEDEDEDEMAHKGTKASGVGRNGKPLPRSVTQGGRFSGRLPRKEDESQLAGECELLGPLIGGSTDPRKCTLARVVRSIASGVVRKSLQSREEMLQKCVQLLKANGIALPSGVSCNGLHGEGDETSGSAKAHAKQRGSRSSLPTSKSAIVLYSNGQTQHSQGAPDAPQNLSANLETTLLQALQPIHLSRPGSGGQQPGPVDVSHSVAVKGELLSSSEANVRGLSPTGLVMASNGMALGAPQQGMGGLTSRLPSSMAGRPSPLQQQVMPTAHAGFQGPAARHLPAAFNMAPSGNMFPTPPGSQQGGGGPHGSHLQLLPDPAAGGGQQAANGGGVTQAQPTPSSWQPQHSQQVQQHTLPFTQLVHSMGMGAGPRGPPPGMASSQPEAMQMPVTWAHCVAATDSPNKPGLAAAQQAQGQMFQQKPFAFALQAQSSSPFIAKPNQGGGGPATQATTSGIPPGQQQMQQMQQQQQQQQQQHQQQQQQLQQQQQQQQMQLQQQQQQHLGQSNGFLHQPHGFKPHMMASTTGAHSNLPAGPLFASMGQVTSVGLVDSQGNITLTPVIMQHPLQNGTMAGPGQSIMNLSVGQLAMINPGQSFPASGAQQAQPMVMPQGGVPVPQASWCSQSQGMTLPQGVNPGQQAWMYNVWGDSVNAQGPTGVGAGELLPDPPALNAMTGTLPGQGPQPPTAAPGSTRLPMWWLDAAHKATAHLDAAQLGVKGGSGQQGGAREEGSGEICGQGGMQQGPSGMREQVLRGALPGYMTLMNAPPQSV